MFDVIYETVNLNVDKEEDKEHCVTIYYGFLTYICGHKKIGVIIK